MKTIEERAKDYAETRCVNVESELHKRLLIDAFGSSYIQGAKEQRKIDIEKACELIEKALQKLTTYKDKDNFTENEFKIITASQIPNWLIKFRKKMEDSYGN